MRMLDFWLSCKLSTQGKMAEGVDSSSRSFTARCLGKVVVCTVLGALAMEAQQATPGEQTRPSSVGQTYNAPGAKYTGKGGSYFVAPQKAKATVIAVDLAKRTIKIVPAKKNGTFRVAEITPEGRVWHQVKEMELTFVTPSGQEQIRASGKAAKRLGKKQLRLDEIPKDARIKVEYYPAGPAAREITVESLPSS